MGSLQLVCTADVEWAAGYDYLLLAVRRLLDTGVNVHLTIPLYGPADQQVRYDIADMALGAAVTRMSTSSSTALAAADVFALTAVRGVRAPLVRAAMAARLPVVAFDAPELAALVDEATGTLVPPRDACAFAQAIARLACDPVGRAAMGENAHRRVCTDSMPT